MNADERTLLTRFLQDLTQAQGGIKDAEAASLIDRAVRTNPDAAYMLVQHAILSDQALHAAQAQIADLQSQIRGGQAPSTSFLGGAGGAASSGASGPWSQRGWSQPQAAAPAYAPPPQQPQPGSGLFGAGAAQPGGFGSFLRSAGTTAAGVAGGAFIADALSGLFGGHHGFGGGFGGGGFGGGGFGGAGVENVTINEYGDQSSNDTYGGDSGYDSGADYDDGGVS